MKTSTLHSCLLKAPLTDRTLEPWVLLMNQDQKTIEDCIQIPTPVMKLLWLYQHVFRLDALAKAHCIGGFFFFVDDTCLLLLTIPTSRSSEQVHELIRVHFLLA